jgi:peptidyl-prolyl cis-trans isomerase SurA
MKQLTKIVFALWFFNAVAQDSSPVLIEFKDEKVTKEEFKRVYQKNNNNEMVNKSTIDEYLELYINFKLKVMEAESLGYDTNNAFVQELSGYRNQLAQPYLTADGVIEELKKEAYQRLQEEIKASHILIGSKPEDAPADTLKAYQKAQMVREKLKSGGDFGELAKQYSDDPSAQKNEGELGYFTAFYMVYPFETAAYNTKEGEISEIVKTRFGYHILKVNERRPYSGEITVAHILISSNPEISKTDDPEARIEEIHEKIEEGESFEMLARQFPMIPAPPPRVGYCPSLV